MGAGKGILSRWFGHRTGKSAAESVPVMLYTKRVCPLCDEMKRELARARTPVRWKLETVEIDGDEELEARFGLSVPVLSILGRPAFKGRLTAEDFVRKLERRVGEGS